MVISGISDVSPLPDGPEAGAAAGLRPVRGGLWRTGPDIGRTRPTRDGDLSTNSSGFCARCATRGTSPCC